MTALCACSTQAHTQAAATGAATLRTGAWDVSSGAPGQPGVAYQLCLRNGDDKDIELLLPHSSSAAAACGNPRLRRDGDVLDWSLECPAAQLFVKARYWLAREHVVGEVGIASGTPPRASTQLITARYAGACAAP